MLSKLPLVMIFYHSSKESNQDGREFTVLRGTYAGWWTHPSSLRRCECYLPQHWVWLCICSWCVKQPAFLQWAMCLMSWAGLGSNIAHQQICAGCAGCGAGCACLDRWGEEPMGEQGRTFYYSPQRWHACNFSIRQFCWFLCLFQRLM